MTDAIIRTHLGSIAITFFDHCPDAVGNFVDLAEDGLYDGAVFDELIRGFIVQGGNIGDDNPDDYLLDEYSPDVQFDRPYRVACVGRGDFSHPSMFFITLRPAEHLNWHHTIFAEVADYQSQLVLGEINDLPKGSAVTIQTVEIVGQP